MLPKNFTIIIKQSFSFNWQINRLKIEMNNSALGFTSIVYLRKINGNSESVLRLYQAS